MGFGPLSGRNPGACVAVTVTALLGSLRAVCKHFWSCLVGDTRSASGVPLAQIELLLLNLSMTDFLHVIKRDSVAEEGITSIVFRAHKLSISLVYCEHFLCTTMNIFPPILLQLLIGKKQFLCQLNASSPVPS